MTKTQYMDHLRELNPYMAGIYETVRPYALPELTKYIACNCFIDQIPENDATRALREQLKNLRDEGQFEFEEE